MSNINIDFNKKAGKIKIMHAVNNGPHVTRGDQMRGNQDYYKAARIPYARTHDAAFHAQYGGEHSVDIQAIFPNFDADVNDPQSYDFACTDKYISEIYEFGTKPFYRLGSKIEHYVKKFGTFPPKDYTKWAQICEHIIAHYTEGWADGFKYDLEYWEIWNEPDLDPDNSPNKRCWQGTEAEFAEFYTVAATYLKNRFPNLKIGGPAIAWNEDWLERFFERIKDKHPPMDFLSWHWYGVEPNEMSKKGTRISKIAKRYGYGDAESILNEWNYVRGWGDEFVYSIETMISIKGACFTSACMAAAQKNPNIDMLMYYDARPCAMNGLFDFYTMRPLKGYYPFYIYANLYEMGNQVKSVSDDKDIYVVSAKNGDKAGIMITYYSEDDGNTPKFVTVNVNGHDFSNAKIYITDVNQTMGENLVNKFDNGKITLRLERNSIVYIENE